MYNIYNQTLHIIMVGVRVGQEQGFNVRVPRWDLFASLQLTKTFFI